LLVLGAAQLSNIANCRQKIDHRHGFGTGNFGTKMHIYLCTLNDQTFGL